MNIEIETIKSNMHKHKISFVIGEAGTGKTTLIKGLVSDDPDEFEVISYTNNAVNILREKSSIDATTIHKALKMSFTYTTDHKEIMVTPLTCCDAHEPIYKLDEYIEYSDLFKCNSMFDTMAFVNKYIIVDECSFISHELYHLIMKLECKGYIFFGDVRQLGSIDDNICNICMKQKCKFNIFDMAEKKNLPVVKLSTNYRNNPEIIKIVSDFTIYHKLNLPRINCKSLLQENKTLSEPILCYRNTTVDYINKMFTSNRQIPVHGDPIYFLSGSSQMIVSKVYIVTDASIVKVIDRIFGELEVLAITIDNKQILSIIDQSILDGVFFNLLSKLDKQSNNSLFYTDARKSLIHAYKAYINPWSFAYALTVHKSQGATFKNSYLYMADFTRIDIDLKRKLIYTALTRATDNVYNILIPSKWIL